MKEYAFIFRNSSNPFVTQSPEQMQKTMTAWMEWMAGMAARNKIADKGNRLSMTNGKTVKTDNVVTDGPYTEIKEFISGYIIVKTDTIEEAVELAKGCPILTFGGNVEVREVVSPDARS